MSIIKDEKIDTKDLKQLIKLVRKTFNPIRMASGITKQNNTQVAQMIFIKYNNEKLNKDWKHGY